VKVGADNYFAIVPEWVVDLDVSDRAFRLYAVLRRHADKETDIAHPGHGSLAKRLRCSVASVKRAIQELEDAGAVIVTTRKNPSNPAHNLTNTYQVISAKPAGQTRVTGEPTPEPRVTGEPRGRVTDEPRGRVTDDLGTIVTELESEDQSHNSGSSTANLEDLGKPTDPAEPSDDDGFVDRPAPNPSDRQVYFMGRLIESDDRWSNLTYGALVGLNKTFGRPVVTEALGCVWEERQGGADTPAKPFALVRAVCQRIARDEANHDEAALDVAMAEA
jgi:biotin operon repressor